jgi:pilus assembly protein CpaB
MDRRLFLVLGLSLIVALVISSVFYFQIVGRSGPKKDANVKEIVVATKQLEVGVTIKPGDVRLAKTSPEMFPKGGFNKIEEVIDRPVVNRILLDEPVQEGRLAVRGSGLGLAPIIPVGMRAVSVRVSDVAGVAGFVLPGLRVDVLVTGKPSGSDGTVTTTCLQNILVLSAGQNIQPDARGQAISTPTVTLLVTPAEAETIILAGNEGRVQLVLRNSSDQGVEKTPGSDINTLYSGRARATPKPAAPEAAPKLRPVSRPKPVTIAAAPVTPPPAPAPPPEIVVIRGNQRTVEVVPQKAN